MEKKKDSHIRLSEWLLRSLIFIIAIGSLTYFFPREGHARYIFQEGRPWAYSLLTAPFDFPIYKDDVVLKQERDSILHDFRPIYTNDTTIALKMVNDFNNALLSYEELSVSSAHRKAYTEALSRIYKDGIISSESYTAIQNGDIAGIRILENNVARNASITRVRSPKVAYEQIISEFSDAYSRHILQTCDLNKYLVENIQFDSITSNKVRDELLQNISLSDGMVQAGERIVDRGEIITPDIYRILTSYETMLSKRTGDDTRHSYYTILGQLIAFSCIIAFLFIFLAFFRHRLWHNIRAVIFIVLLTVFVSIASFIASGYGYHAIFLVPIAIVPITMITFFDSRVALQVHLITVLICSFAAPDPLMYIFIQMIVGMAAIASLSDLSKRSQLFRCAAIVFVTYTISYAGFTLFTEGDFHKISVSLLFNMAINSVILLFSYLLIYIFERTFGFLSSVTLVELSDINSPLLQRLSEEAPGTFQHAMQVSNLAAAAANRVGASAQLVRTGALYHDIGKLTNPAFFTENQSGSVSPHDNISLTESARIIISHVADGLKMAEKAGLPRQVQEFIATHHGHGKARYFYNTYRNQHPNEPIDEEVFTYPGHNPTTKETGILMMADAVEAASRSLKEYNETTISQLVNRIVDNQIAEGLLRDTPLSFRDVEAIKETFTEKLMTIYHTRIAYPTLNK